MKICTFSNLLKSKSISFLALVLVFSISFAQNPYTIQFQDETIDMPENIDTFQWNQMPENAQLANGYVGWIQFYQTPTQDIQDQFASNNLQLLDYVPHQTYLFYFPASTSVEFLQQSGVRSIVPVEGRFKLSQKLINGNIGEWARRGNHYLVTLEYHDVVDSQFVISDLATKQISVEEEYRGFNMIDLLIPDNCLDSLSELPYVKWVELFLPPGEPEDESSKSLMRSNGLDTQTAGGLNYDGDGVGVLTRDQGPIWPHVDFTGRLTNIPPFSSGTHGIQVTGAMAGAGNIIPFARGSAAGATIFATGYNPTFLDPATTNAINSGDAQITNSSYSNGCNDGYTTNARTVDTQMKTITSLQHVFSAGNSNGSNCGYGAGSQWGNVTGGHKTAKNCITVAAAAANGAIASFSSRGPVEDGRIKPDLAGHGASVLMTNPNNAYTSSSGTSFSAPATAGVAAQLYQVYMDANGGALPDAALIKAALLNSATDFGNAGPDFIYGWGMVNGLRSGMVIENGNYLSDDVSQGNTNTHTINVPSGTAQVRFMLYWNDEPGLAGANPALVNDLDLVVTDPGAGTHLPFLLDHTPNATALNTPAGNGVDHLNNMEQVLIDAPAAGNYDLDITGFNVPMGPQEYFIVYDFIADNVTVTHPNGGEKLTASNSTLIHWDSVNTTSGFTVEYSDDNGGSWNTIGTAPATARNIVWPLTGLDTSGEMLVRVTSGSFSDTSDENFNIAPIPSGLQLVEMCPTEATFEWTAVTGAESYDLYLLGDEFMEIAGTSSTNSITVPITDPDATYWMAVAANNATEGWEGRRSNASSYNGGENCGIIGFEDNVLANSVTLYPNPASEEVFVSVEDLSFENFQVTVLNSLGQTITTVSAEGSQTSINISSYTTGLYFVTIEIDGVSTTKKLVVR